VLASARPLRDGVDVHCIVRLRLRWVAERAAAEQPGRPRSELVAVVVDEAQRLGKPFTRVDRAAQNDRFVLADMPPAAATSQ
jgi:hypothetical protein